MPSLVDLTGKTFGKLTVIRRDTNSKSKRVAWECLCECGNKKSVQGTHLRSGATVSCGCHQRERAREVRQTHGHSKTSLHYRWKAIKQRCYNENSPRYKDYGGRGIKMADEFLDFEFFYKWCIDNGYNDKLSIDRINNNEGYYPSNIRFTDDVIQNRNKRNVVWINYNNSKIKLREVSDITGINYNTLYTRYRKFDKEKVDVKDILNDEYYKLITSHFNKKLLKGVETR